jgi:Fe-S-cluster containining protein
VYNGRMAIPLTGVDEWERFLKRREELTRQMELSACDGCDDCGGRCIAGFVVARSEWEAVVSYLAEQPPAEVSRVRAQDKKQPWPGAEELGVEVEYCRFRDLENGRCSIYPVRPAVCRLFGHVEWLPCPIERVEPVVAQAAELWADYCRFERKTWADWEEDDRAMENGAGRHVVLL